MTPITIITKKAMSQWSKLTSTYTVAIRCKQRPLVLKSYWIRWFHRSLTSRLSSRKNIFKATWLNFAVQLWSEYISGVTKSYLPYNIAFGNRINSRSMLFVAFPNSHIFTANQMNILVKIAMEPYRIIWMKFFNIYS